MFGPTQRSFFFKKWDVFFNEGSIMEVLSVNLEHAWWEHYLGISFYQFGACMMEIGNITRENLNQKSINKSICFRQTTRQWRFREKNNHTVERPWLLDLIGLKWVKQYLWHLFAQTFHLNQVLQWLEKNTKLFVWSYIYHSVYPIFGLFGFFF